MSIGQLGGGQPVTVLSTRGDQRVDQLVAGLGLVVDVEDAEAVADVVPLLGQQVQQPHRRRRGVQPDGVPHPRVLRRIRRKHQCQLLFRVGDAAQPGVVDGDPRDPRAPLGVGHVVREPVVVDLLERERRRDDAAVELGDGDLGGRIQRRDTVGAGQPVLPRRRQAQSLQGRDVEGRDALDVPGAVVTARAGARRPGSAGGQDADHQRVEGAHRVEQFLRSAAQRRREDRNADRVARRVDGVDEGMDETGVAADLVRPVVQHPDPQPVARLAVSHAPLWNDHRLLEALTGEQHGVAEERVHLGEVVRPALGEIRVRLGRDAHRHRRTLHQLRTGLALTPEDDERQSTGAQHRELRCDLRRGPEHPQHDQGGVGDQWFEFLAHRVPEAEAGATRARRQQVGVRGGQQRDARCGGSGSRHRQGSYSGFAPLIVRMSRDQYLAQTADTSVFAIVTVAEPPRSRTGFLATGRASSA